MARIRINTRPGFDYASVTVLDYCPDAKKFVADRRIGWTSANPPGFMLYGRNAYGKPLFEQCTGAKTEAVIEAYSYFIDCDHDVKIRRFREDRWEAPTSETELRRIIEG